MPQSPVTMKIHVGLLGEDNSESIVQRTNPSFTFISSQFCIHV